MCLFLISSNCVDSHDRIIPFEIVTVLPQLTCNYTSNVSMHALCAHMTVRIKIIIGFYCNYGLVHTGSDHEDRRNIL